ncbi:MAG TPA: NAD(P)H-binding protein [Candidatus Omnitrophota bacterium]|nr:NAD(P)H-binding protein [Candidatus Omnitrophota bacterium]HPD84815.1 NAD(P)H-binding protein [Candidatus Omnitrophota bacterium]HRZ03673.1 NAD(P)H-binding protein [Candidatus Omnitrophota bacterium]
MATPSNKILVLGASGYVGSRLVTLLLQKGYTVRATARSLDTLKKRPWSKDPNVELFPADILNQNSLKQACQGCGTAYYLVHSMSSSGRNFADADRKAAQNMIAISPESTLKRIIYLSGLGDVKSDLSEHLRSRMEVCRILHSGKVPTTTLRAAIIIGTASVPFELMRYLIERLPIMITPRGVNTKVQPIGIRNVLGYLIGCLEKEETTGETYDIGGPDIMSYKDLMGLYAQVAGFPKRPVIAVPFLTPRLISCWTHLITPIPDSIARPLTEGLTNTVICRENRIQRIIPQELINCRQAIRLALNLEQKNLTDLLGQDEKEFIAPEYKYPGDPFWAGTAKVR